MKKKKKSDELEEYEDVTVADMNVEGMPWYKDPEEKKRADEMDDLRISRAERRAMVKGAYRALLPIFFIGLGIFCLAFGIMMLYFYLATR